MTVTGSESVLEQGTITIECNIRANPRARVNWLLLKNNPIEITRIISGVRVVIIEPNEAMSTLRITKATATDTGMYVCVADNEVGPSSTGQHSVTVTSELLSDTILPHIYNVIFTTSYLQPHIYNLIFTILFFRYK